VEGKRLESAEVEAETAAAEGAEAPAEE